MKVKSWMLCLTASLALATTVQAQGPGGGGRGRGGFGGGVFSVAQNEAVQKDLGLSTEVAAKVKEITDEQSKEFREAIGGPGGGGGGGGGFGNMSEEDRRKFQEKMSEATKTTTAKFLPQLKDALTADQFARLQQINWQNMGTRAFAETEVVKSLTITKEQQDKLKGINDEFDKKRGELFAGGGGRGPEMFEKMQEMNKERDAKLTEAMTPAQLEKFAMLKGKEFDVTQLGRGGPGGGGGGGAGARPKRPQPKVE